MGLSQGMDYAVFTWSLQQEWIMANKRMPRRDDRKEADSTSTAAEASETPKLSKKTKPRTKDTEANPPRTTTKWLTAPKFGSAGSGGAEIEPGIKRD
jgi:hypothetical protein